MAQMGQNSLPDDWVRHNSILCQANIPILNKEKNDVVRWQSQDKNMVNFSINRAWKDLSENYGKVDWCNVVWFSNMIPRHAFIVYDEMDSHEHLFFKCQYADKIWREAIIKCQMKGRSNEWKSIIDELIRLPKRNSRNFQNMRKDWKEVWDSIEEVMKMKLSRLKFKRTEEVPSAYNIWGTVLS
ncbi:hypothetical protein Tco_0892381 [Tanacetum coccineum]|uniref:Uncharacterized protein n=1 Tax=Tanacetum coccineum TaxID=301880 RepID=A0ABQ5C7A4_9ASTR